MTSPATEQNNLGWPASLLPSEPTKDTPALPSSRSRRRSARHKRSEAQEFPRWFKSEKAQQAAEFIAFNVAIDKMLGVTPSLDRYPYSEFKPNAVRAFLRRLGINCTESASTSNPKLSKQI